MRTLIVEDDYCNQLLLRSLLKPFGQTTIAEDGEVAIERFFAGDQAGEPYDVVFMDLFLPHVNGFEAIRRIRDWEAQHPNRRPTVIVVDTASSRPEDLDESEESRYDYYIMKPFTIEKIELILAECGFLRPCPLEPEGA